MKFESQVHYQRFMLGAICGLLPLLCVLFGLFGEVRGINHPGWYNSISATYFSNGNMCMIGALCLCAFFLEVQEVLKRKDAEAADRYKEEEGEEWRR